MTDNSHESHPEPEPSDELGLDDGVTLLGHRWRGFFLFGGITRGLTQPPGVGTDGGEKAITQAAANALDTVRRRVRKRSPRMSPASPRA
jgi:hypothetical protein